ncbi:MAG: phosphatase PAP2 family protein [Cyanobacteria bacterium K_DeepCast_35m_m2_023]|nr:phosphatase PAP2 family protein [Cyanobacteria bacterium K_DeepCast_35m_m2_023]
MHPVARSAQSATWWAGVVATTLVGFAPVGLGSWAQPADPAAGLSLSPDRYRAVVGSLPAPGTPQDAEDLAILRWNQRSLYPEAVIHTWRFLDRNISTFDAAVGSDLTKISPNLSMGLPAFLKRVEAVKDVLKDQLARPRPYVRDRSIKPCLPLETTFSYPSGHATWYATAALLLADLLPARRERLLAVGMQGAYARPACLVHYPSDVLASLRLAEAASRDVIDSPQWQEFKRQVQPELQHLLVAPPAGLPLLLALLWTLLPQGGPALALPQRVVLLRHGHKLPMGEERVNYNLSETGFLQAFSLSHVLLACLLKGQPLQLVSYGFDPISGKNARSYQTLVPLAVASGVNIRLFEDAATGSEAAGCTLLKDPGYAGAWVVAAWEHRRLPELARGLGWPTMPVIASDDFDGLWVLDYFRGSTRPRVTVLSQQQLAASSCGRRSSPGTQRLLQAMRRWLLQIQPPPP